MKQNRLPKGWTEARVRRVLRHYEAQSEAHAVAEDEAAEATKVINVPLDLVPEVEALIARYRKKRSRED